MSLVFPIPSLYLVHSPELKYMARVLYSKFASANLRANLFLKQILLARHKYILDTFHTKTVDRGSAAGVLAVIDS